MQPFFISYRREPWRQEVLSLSRECRRRGVGTIVDVSDPGRIAGRAQFDALRRVIRDDCDGFILYATRNIIDSTCVWNLEVPTALERLDRGSYDFLPVFRDLSPSEMARLQPHGRRVSVLAGVCFRPRSAGIDDVSRMHVDVANLALARWISRHSDAGAATSVRVALRTRATGVQALEPDLTVDWTADYEEVLSGAARRDGDLGRALWDMTRAIAASGARAIRIDGPAHLSAGCAAGFAFSRAAGFELRVTQRDAVWRADGAGASPPGLRVATEQLDPGQPDVALTVAISRPEVVTDVDSAVGKLDLPVGGRVVVLPEGGARRDAVLSDSHARAIVQEIVGNLMRVRAEWGCRGAIHVFMAAPFGLAALLGHALNGFGRLCLYEHTGAGDNYVLVFSLPHLEI